MGNFSDGMRVCIDRLDTDSYPGDIHALRQRLTRFAHMYSHDESQDTSSIVAPDELLATLTAMFEFVAILDAAHLDGLCSVTGIDRGTLTAPRASAASESPTA
jgi:hypothetical protein